MPNSNDFSHQDGVTLKEHFEALLHSLDLRAEQARQSMEKRLEGMNEFREAIKDQASKFPTRDEVCAIITPIERELKILNTFKDALEGKASQKDVTVAMVISGFGILLSVVSLVLRLIDK
jgi:2-hydroxy-3-keto-5-methylthiopentenyl-1-phosphate phosphatase